MVVTSSKSHAIRYALIAIVSLQLITYVTSEPWFYRAGDSERKPPSFNGGEADVAPMMNEEGVQGKTRPITFVCGSVIHELIRF